jgi:hypothetical protein
MDIKTTREFNSSNLQMLESYLGVPQGSLLCYYDELLEDSQLLEEINGKMQTAVRNHDFKKGIFAKGSIDCLDWFAYQRILIYVLIRHLKPKHVLETGVFYGGNTVFLLAAAKRNKMGTVHSVDLPDSKIRALKEEAAEYHTRHPLVGDSELYDESLSPGFIIPDYLKNQWRFTEGSSLEIIPQYHHEFGFYLHDSDHSYGFLNQELALAYEKLSNDAVLVVDDLNWSNSFFKLCTERKLYPLLATDNGKGDLMVRTGIVKLDHPYNGNPAVTG